MQYHSIVKLKKKICLSIIFICLLFLCSCNTHEADVSSYAKAYLGLEVFLAEVAVIQVEYEEVWYFEPYSKQYYIETENWGKYGLEQDAELAKKTALDYLDLKDDEHVVYIQTYDYQVCDYVEEVVYTTADNDEVRMYCILLDREDGFIGSSMHQWEQSESNKGNIDKLKGRVLSELDNFSERNSLSYEPQYLLYDLNKDGEIDMYINSSEVYLWDAGGYRMCTDEEGKSLVFSRYTVNDDIVEREKIENFKEEYVTSELVYGQGTYIQFHDILYADKINEQIVEMIESNKNNYLSINIADIVYVGEKFLVLLMLADTEGGEYPTGETAYNSSRYLTFSLDNGELISFEDILGSNYEEEDIKNLMWKAYERKITEVPDQYSKELFDDYYEKAFEIFEEDLTESEELQDGSVGARTPVLEEYIQCYFTDEGIIVTYGLSGRFGWNSLPINYDLDDRLGRIDTDDVLEIFCPWEEICEDV